LSCALIKKEKVFFYFEKKQLPNFYLKNERKNFFF